MRCYTRLTLQQATYASWDKPGLAANGDAPPAAKCISEGPRLPPPARRGASPFPQGAGPLLAKTAGQQSGRLPWHGCSPVPLQRPRAGRAEPQPPGPVLPVPVSESHVPCTTDTDSTFPRSRPPPRIQEGKKRRRRRREEGEREKKKERG